MLLKKKIKNFLLFLIITSIITSIITLFNCNILLAANSSNTYKHITLFEGVNFLTTNAPTLINLELEIRNNDLSKKNAFAAFLPSLDFQATHGLHDSYSNYNNPQKNMWTSNLSLDLSETFYDNGVSRANYKISQLKKQKSELNYKKELERLTSDFCNEFLNYSYLKKLLSVQEEQLSLLKRQNEIISKTYYQGLKTKKDYLRSKTDLNRMGVDLLATINSIERSKMELFKLINLPYEEYPKTNFIPIDENNDTLKFNLNTTFETPKIESYIEYKNSLLQQDITELETSMIDRKNWPELSISSGVSYSTNTYMGSTKSWHTSFTDNDSTSWNILFKINYNILDWGVRSRNKEMALNRQISEKKQFESDVLVLKTNMSKLLIDLQERISNFKNSEELLLLEKDSYQLIYAEYRNGKVQYLDLITALKSLIDAKTRFYSAFYDLKKGIFSYYFNQGTLHDFIKLKKTFK
ncbi:MAG: TolC family protein [Oligoflexia bacterium]|nr:TolC family protein [Oligoflexia bacterium]